MAAMAPATASRPWPLPRVLLNIPADASRLALLQPAARIDRIAVAAQFDIQRRPALAAGIADAGDRNAALDLRPGVLEQGVVVGVPAHVSVETGRAPCRDRVCPSGKFSEVVVSLKKKK